MIKEAALGDWTVWRHVLVGGFLLGVFGCQEAGTPSSPTGGAHLILRLEQVRSDETLDVAPYYRHADQSVVALEALQVPLEGSGSQSISIEIDIDSCLADAARESPGTGCPLRLTLVLRNELHELLDSLEVGPLAVGRGANTTVPVNPGGFGLIGPQGGTVHTTDGAAVLVVPPGALSTPTTIGIRTVANYPADPRVSPGTVYQLTPRGCSLPSRPPSGSSTVLRLFPAEPFADTDFASRR